MNYYTTEEDRRRQNEWRKNTYGKNNIGNSNNKKITAAPSAVSYATDGAVSVKETKNVVPQAVVADDNAFVHSNEYTTTAQRKAQQKSVNNFLTQKPLYSREYKERDERINKYLHGNGEKSADANMYGNIDSDPKMIGTNGNTARTTAQPKKEKSIFEKVENQSVNYAKSGWKLFDWMDDFSNNKGPNSEAADTVKVKATEKADITAGAQGTKPQKTVDVFVSKDSVREAYVPTERQNIFNELLETYGEIGRKGVEERHSLAPDASVYDISAERQRIIELENQLDMLDREEKTGLYDEDMTLLDRFGNTAKEWGNRLLYSPEYIAQTAGTALTDFAESQLNEDYNNAIKNRQNIIVQLNRICFGLDEDPYGKNEARLLKQLENINRYIDENFREKMDTTTDAYRAMDRAERYEDKAVEGLSSAKRLVYNVATNAIELVPKVVINKYVPGYLLTTDIINESSEKMHETNSSGGTAGQAFVNGAVNAGISAVSEKMQMKELSSFVQSDIGKIVLKEELAKHGLNISKGVLEYTIKHLADVAAQNPYAELSLDEMVEELVKDYTETAIKSF